MAPAGLAVLVLVAVLGPVLSEKHSLYYIYSALSKDVDFPGIHKFTALGLLDDREIDYYNSKIQEKIPKQNWMREKMADDYWEKGTQSRKSKEQWFNVNVGILIKRMNHSETDMHVLQWRHGCEIDTSSGGVKFLRGIDEYSYDGSEFLAFDDENLRWIAPVAAAEPTKRKWDDVPILNQYTKGYLEKECVDWLTKFMEYGKEELRNHSKPDVHAFAKKSVSDPEKVTLTCLATGFYPKDVTMCVRKYRTSVPEHLLTSSGVRPNGDGTYQLRKSMEIQKDEKSRYECYVSHSSLDKPVIKEWDHRCIDCEPVPVIPIGVGVAAVIGLILLVVGIVLFLKKKKENDGSPTPSQASTSVAMQPQPESTPLVVSAAAPGDNDSGRGSVTPSNTNPNSDTSSQSGASHGESSHGSVESVKDVNNQPQQEEQDSLLTVESK